jgi:glucose-6-phosphate dehydrogenase assembly protein OpcA
MPTVNDTVWREQDTTPAAIEAALREMLIERHAESEFYVPARVLNLVCVVEREWSGEIANRLRGVGRFHPSRTIVCSVSPKRTTLDAIATVAATANPQAGSLALTRETVVIDVGTRHIPYLDTIIDPLVVTDLATMVWAPHGHWDAVEALRRMSQIVLVDSVDDPDVAGALRRATELIEDRNVVDLAWIRSAPWRERIAASFDSPRRRPELTAIRGVELRHHPESGAAALLMFGWLTSRLGWEPSPLTLPERGHATGRVAGPGGEVELNLRSVPLDVPGLSGITLTMDDGSSLSLERGRGGLRATRRTPAGSESSWTLLGASRGEGGILGEGIRQALMRDEIYGPALRATAGLLA